MLVTGDSDTRLAWLAFTASWLFLVRQTIEDVADDRAEPERLR